jgi:GNAT superfamily N-acetyltransferase
MLDIKFDQINEKYVRAASDLVMAEYIEEKREVPYLPDDEKFLNYFREAIEDLFNTGMGIVAIIDGELIGFIAGYKVEEFFGKCKGIYSPLYGHGAVKKYRSSIYKKMYQQAADLWTKEAFTTHALTFFAHDKETIDTWFWQGFGLRCVDAIREVSPINIKNSDITICKAGAEDILGLEDIHRLHCQYYKKSPIFMIKSEGDPVKDLCAWLEEDNHHLWVAYNKEIPVGYMRIEPESENFISDHSDVMNITSAFVKESERGAHIGAVLLNAIQQWLLQNNYPLCGVDFESINTIGSHFWNKYFTPYTYSLVRRIDERSI